MTIFTGALIVDTSTSTAASEKILEEALAWGADELGLTYRPEMIKRRQYISDLVFYSDIQLVAVQPAFIKLQKAVTEAGEHYLWQRREYELTHFGLDFDHTLTPLVAAPFSIQRRGNTLFTDNKYFSEAPFPTDVHIKLVEQLEADLACQRQQSVRLTASVGLLPFGRSGLHKPTRAFKASPPTAKTKTNKHPPHLQSAW